MNYTVDASVFVATARSAELHHPASMEFLLSVREQTTSLFCPTLILPECAAAISRQTDQSALARKTVLLVLQFPNLFLVSLDTPLARRAAEIAETHRLRGADGVYAAVAEAFQATLITWDSEMLQRAPAVTRTITPAQWLELAAGATVPGR